MKAFIYTGGGIRRENITERPDGDALVIAADSGYRNAEEMGICPSVLVGDFDSLAGELPEGVEIVKLPAEKDYSDTQVAVNIALERGADSIVIIGGLDGRLDHALSNMAIVEKLTRSGVSASITDGYNRVRFISSSSALIARGPFKYLSLIPTEPVAKGVDVKGCRYPLERAKLCRGEPSFAISNEIVENCALVSVRRGGLYIIESNDKD